MGKVGGKPQETIRRYRFLAKNKRGDAVRRGEEESRLALLTSGQKLDRKKGGKNFVLLRGQNGGKCKGRKRVMESASGKGVRRGYDNGADGQESLKKEGSTEKRVGFSKHKKQEVGCAQRLGGLKRLPGTGIE